MSPLLAVRRDISIHTVSSEPFCPFLSALCPPSAHRAHIDICFRKTTRPLTLGREEVREQRVEQAVRGETEDESWKGQREKVWIEVIKNAEIECEQEVVKKRIIGERRCEIG